MNMVIRTLLLDLSNLKVLPDRGKTDEGADESEDDCPEGVFCHSLGDANELGTTQNLSSKV